MCRGSFFDEWPYCLQCLFFHGLRSERDVAHYRSVITTASAALCDVPTPTAHFAEIFTSARDTVPVPTTGATVSSDQAPGQTAVSLYFTATRHQGPGQITGEATAATATIHGLFTAPRLTTTPAAATGADNADAAGRSSPPVSGSGAGGSGAGSGGSSARVGAEILLSAVVVAIAGVVVVL